MKETYYGVWGLWFIPPAFRCSLDDIRSWAKRKGLAREENFLGQEVLKELRRLYPGYMGVGVLVHLRKDMIGRLSYKERPFVSVAALISRNEEHRIFRFELRHTENEVERVLFTLSSPSMPGVYEISSVSSSKRICHRFLSMLKTLEEQGYDVRRYFEKTDLDGIRITDEVFEADLSADLRANFSREPENRRIHDVEFRFAGLVPAQSSGSANPYEKTLQRLIEEFLSPYRSSFDYHPGVTAGFLAVLDLLVRHGDCPSVVTTMVNRDSEALDLSDFMEILKKVTLLDHSVNVARMMLKHVKEAYCGMDYVSLIPKAFLVSFGHDLGKIPSLRANLAYPDPDHPLISAKKLEEIFRSKPAPRWFPDAIDLIRHHDGPISKDSSIPLRWADLRARETEIEAYGNGLKVIGWKEWFDVNRFLEIMRPTVNLLRGTRGFNAFSLGSLVYCQPNFLYESAGKLASEKKVLDLGLHIPTEKERALRGILSLGSITESFSRRIV